MLRNLSQTGARIEGQELDGCPEAFELRIVHETGAVERLYARLIWRQPGVIGVRFEEPHAIAVKKRLKVHSRVG